MRVGIITWDNPLGMDGFDGVKRWVERQGGKVEIVKETFATAMAMDYSTQLTSIKAENPDIIVASVSGGAHGMISRDAARVGLSKDIPIINQAAVFSVGNIKLAGDEVGRGVCSSVVYPPWMDTPGMNLVKEIIPRYYPRDELTVEHFICVRNSMTLAEAIRIALDKVSYEELTSSDILQAFDEIKNFENMNIGCPQSFGDYPGDRIGMTAFQMWGWDKEQGRVKILSDWLEPVTLEDLGYVG